MAHGTNCRPAMCFCAKPDPELDSEGGEETRPQEPIEAFANDLAFAYAAAWRKVYNTHRDSHDAHFAALRAMEIAADRA